MLKHEEPPIQKQNQTYSAFIRTRFIWHTTTFNRASPYLQERNIRMSQIHIIRI